MAPDHLRLLSPRAYHKEPSLAHYFFLIYINDISDVLSPGTVIRLFAAFSIAQLNPAKTTKMEFVCCWEIENKMEFHPGKCQVLRITNKTVPRHYGHYSIHDTDLEIVKSAKYLGVIIDSKLNWSDQISSACGKASGTLAFLQRNMNFCPMGIKEKCISTLVRPVLEYGCCV